MDLFMSKTILSCQAFKSLPACLSSVSCATKGARNYILETSQHGSSQQISDAEEIFFLQTGHGQTRIACRNMNRSSSPLRLRDLSSLWSISANPYRTSLMDLAEFCIYKSSLPRSCLVLRSPLSLFSQQIWSTQATCLAPVWSWDLPYLSFAQQMWSPVLVSCL